MFVYVGKSYTATLRGSRIVPVTCERCQARFSYELIRVGIGRASAPYYIGQAAAADRAAKAAEKDLAKRLRTRVGAGPVSRVPVGERRPDRPVPTPEIPARPLDRRGDRGRGALHCAGRDVRRPPSSPLGRRAGLPGGLPAVRGRGPAVPVLAPTADRPQSRWDGKAGPPPRDAAGAGGTPDPGGGPSRLEPVGRPARRAGPRGRVGGAPAEPGRVSRNSVACVSTRRPWPTIPPSRLTRTVPSTCPYAARAPSALRHRWRVIAHDHLVPHARRHRPGDADDSGADTTGRWISS